MYSIPCFQLYIQTLFWAIHTVTHNHVFIKLALPTSHIIHNYLQLAADEYGMVRYMVASKKGEANMRRVSPEEIGSHVLKQLKTTAEHHLNAPVTKAVISVPAEFNELQRNYTIRAANLAGYDQLYQSLTTNIIVLFP